MESQAVFQVKTQAKMLHIELQPCRDPFTIATLPPAQKVAVATGSKSSSWLSRSVTMGSVKKYFYR